jgi:predicted Fe-Mo cluster-binding NifX family protein
MLIAIATNNNDLKATVDPHFGRCDWFFIYNSETHEQTFIENPACNIQEKAGYEAAELLIGKSINMVIAGRFGSKVVDVFRKKNIQMVVPEKVQSLTEIINLIQ